MILGAWIGILSQICENFQSRYLEKYAFDHYYCTYLHKIWHVYYVGGPTYTHAKILNKNKIQDGGGRYLKFLHKQQ